MTPLLLLLCSCLALTFADETWASTRPKLAGDLSADLNGDVVAELYELASKKKKSSFDNNQNANDDLWGFKDAIEGRDQKMEMRGVESGFKVPLSAFKEPLTERSGWSESALVDLLNEFSQSLIKKRENAAVERFKAQNAIDSFKQSLSERRDSFEWHNPIDSFKVPIRERSENADRKEIDTNSFKQQFKESRGTTNEKIDAMQNPAMMFKSPIEIALQQRQAKSDFKENEAMLAQLSRFLGESFKQARSEESRDSHLQQSDAHGLDFKDSFTEPLNTRTAKDEVASWFLPELRSINARQPKDETASWFLPELTRYAEQRGRPKFKQQ